jgi:HK97 family phage major capsid protein
MSETLTPRQTSKHTNFVADRHIMKEEFEGDKLVGFGGSVKALGGGRVGGYLVMYGSPDTRDLHGEYFDRERTNFMMDDYPIKGERVLYNHGLDRTLNVKRIGQFDAVGTDEVGIWVEAQLNMADAYQRAIYQMAESGKLGWSSGSLPQAVRTAEDGCIEQWAVIEGSLTPSPADPRNRARVVPIKALVDVPVNTPEEQAEADDQSAPVKEEEAGLLPMRADAESAQAILNSETDVSGDTTMDNEKLAHIIGVALKTVVAELGIKMSDEDMQKAKDMAEDEVMSMYGEQEDEAEVRKSIASEEFVTRLADIANQVSKVQDDQLASSIKNIMGKRQPAPGLPAVSSNGGRQQQAQYAPRLEVSSKYANMDVKDMAFAAFVKKTQERFGRAQYDMVGEQQFYRELADKASKAISANQLDRFAVESNVIKMVNAIKADELNYTTQAGYGEEWVADLWSNDLWRQDRVDNPVWSAMRVTDMPSNPYTLPIEGADPTVYRVPETTDEADLNPGATPFTSSKVATGKRTLEAYKMGVRVPFSAEMTEDSIIAFAPELRRQAMEAMVDAIEYVLLQADSTIASSPSGNINRYDGATQATDPDRWLLGFDGVAHLPLVENTALSLDAGGAAPTLSLLREVRRKLPVNRVGKLSDLVYVTDPITATKLLDIDEVLTVDKIGDRATVLRGQIASIDSIPILQTDQFGLADENGKLSETGTNNTRGRILLIHIPSWRVGYRRQIKTSVDYLAWSDSYVLTSSVRVALFNRDTQASTILYNLSV